VTPEEINETQPPIQIELLHDHSGRDFPKINAKDLSGGFENIVNDPNPIRGRLTYGVTNAKFRGCNGTIWKDLTWSDDLSVYTLELASPSVTLRLSDDTGEYIDNAGYTMIKEIEVSVTGKVKTMFDLVKYGAGVGDIAGKIYVNGVAAGEEHVTNNTWEDYETFTDAAIDVESGDLVQVYVKTVTSAEEQYVRNFRIYYDLSTKGYIDAGDDALQTQIDAAHWEYISADADDNVVNGTGSINGVPATCYFIVCQLYNATDNNQMQYHEFILAREGKTTALQDNQLGATVSLTFDTANNQIDYVEAGTDSWKLNVWYYT
jgi:hypothetical protein